jgi:hypothetical protein
MSPFSSEEFARRVIRTVQIIVAALVQGPIVFAGVAIFQRMNQQPQQDASLAYIAAGFAAMTLVIRSFIGAAVVASHRKRIAAGSWSLNVRGTYSNMPADATDGDRLLFVFQQKTIIESALVEGAAFFVLVTFLLVGQWWSLAIAGALITVILVPFPTYDRVEDWVRYQLELLQLERP